MCPRTCRTPTATRAALGHGAGLPVPARRARASRRPAVPAHALLGTYFYAPPSEGYEAEVNDRLERWREAQRQALEIERTEDVPALSEAEVLDLKRRAGRRTEPD